MPGSGKTLLAGHIAAQAAAEDAGPVVLLDGDPAGSLTRWLGRRDGAAPVLGAWDASFTAPGFQQMAANGVELVVIDTPSDLTPDLEPMVAVADLVVIPVRPGPGRPGGRGNRPSALRRAWASPLFSLLTRSDQSNELPAAAVIALAQYGTVCPVILPERPEFAACQGEGKLVGDLEPPSPAAEDIGRLWDYLAEHAERAAQRKEPQDRRHAPRQPYDQIATFTLSGEVYPCRINDISAGGISLWTDQPLPQGQKPTLHIPYLGEFSTETVYLAGERGRPEVSDRGTAAGRSGGTPQRADPGRPRGGAPMPTTPPTRHRRRRPWRRGRPDHGHDRPRGSGPRKNSPARIPKLAENRPFCHQSFSLTLTTPHAFRGIRVAEIHNSTPPLMHPGKPRYSQRGFLLFSTP